ncbi:hypothetical protein RhoFasSB10_00378 [Rhodococcus fascians]|uniref:SIR2 family protein n=1 Tax=Rhodococcoides fascians TaxID=1828 RepID=UPI001427AD4F|nr:hypothetical protein [Rhodococcus fascians]
MNASAIGPLSASGEVCASFSDGQWRDLDVARAADDEKVAVASILKALRNELSLIASAETLVVLAGSGCSLGIGAGKAGKCAPKMSDLWTRVEGLESYATVKARLSPTVIDSGNLEHVLSEAQARLSLEPSDVALGTFVRDAEEIVWTECNFIDEGSDLDKHQLFLRKVGRRSTRLQRTQIFTTNYDRAFEEAAGRTRFNVIDGFGYGARRFDGGSFDLDYVRRRPNEQLALEPNVFHLLKLHGSVDWHDDGTVINRVEGRPGNPVLIYPSATKYQLSYRQPYLEFMSRFQIALRQPNVGLIVVGFGFNDDHLNAPIEAAIRSNTGLRSIFVTPAAKGASNSSTIGWIERLILLGDRRLTLFNATFDQLVRALPDGPEQEDVDLHADRIAQQARPGSTS